MEKRLEPSDQKEFYDLTLWDKGKQIQYFRIFILCLNREEIDALRTSQKKVRVCIVGGNKVTHGRFQALADYVVTEINRNQVTNEQQLKLVRSKELCIITPDAEMQSTNRFEVQYQDPKTGKITVGRFRAYKGKNSLGYRLNLVGRSVEKTIMNLMRQKLYVYTGYKAPKKQSEYSLSKANNSLSRLYGEGPPQKRLF